MPEITYLDAIHAALDEALAFDENVFIIGEDVGVRGGVFRATDGLMEKYGAHRVIDSPLAESVIVGAGIGAGCYGMRPIVEIQFADFIFPATNQIVSEAALLRYRSNGAWGAPMVIRTPCGGGIHGALYHSQSIEAFFAHTPGLKVVMPSTPYDAKGLLAAAIADPDPVLFLEHKKLYRAVRGAVPSSPYTVPLGQADIKRNGSDVSVITYGAMVHEALAAADRLVADGIDVEVVDIRTIRPLDHETILRSVRKTGKVLVLHEDNLTGGIGGEIAALISEYAFEHLDGPVQRLGGPDVPAMPFAKDLESAYLITADVIYDRLAALAAY